MDYEKAYKEALERAKEFYILCKKCGAKDTVDFLEDAFPKLKESEDGEEIVKLADEYYNKVLIKECGMKEEEAHHCRIAYIHGAKAMLNRLRCIKQRNTWKPSEEQLKFLQYYADQNNYSGTVLTSLLNDLKKLNQQKSE